MTLCRCGRGFTLKGSGLCQACQERVFRGGRKGGKTRKQQQQAKKGK